MSEPYVGEIRMVGFNFAPVGWMLCAGQTLPISEYETLFVLLGTTYGGDGVNTFQLPDLQGRVPIHQSSGFVMGQKSGVESVTLSMSTIASHTHTIAAQSATGTAQSPAGGVFAASGAPQYETSANGVSGQAVSSAGSGQAHENRMPYLAVNYIISLFGVFPSQS